MDAHLFSRFCEELAPRIIGGWLEKVQEPAPGLLAFNINLAARGQSYGQAGGSRKCQLCLRAARKEPFLFLSRSRLAAGRAPSAPVMRLRKYLAGHRILAAVCCFSRRQLWLLVGGEAAEREPLATWLLLDLREGASVRFLPVSRSPQEESLRWPEPGELEEALAHWRDWPVLTPALRRALPLYDELDRQALLEDLRLGGGDVFYYTPPDGEVEEKAGSERPSCRIAAWPLPDALAQGWHEEQGEDILGLVEKAGQKLVLEKAARDAAGAAALPLSRRLRKLEQLLAKLDEEEQRLLGMCAAREDGLLLQAWLWRWPADFRAPELVLPPPDEGDGDTPRKTVKLDMRRSVRDNMERLFHTARRGQRGLEHLAERRAVLRAELATVQAARQEALLGGIGHAAGEAGKPDRNTVALGALRGAALPRNVQLFVSDDGFALLRGRDAKGNIAARKLAAAHDIWLHTDGGPGSHVIIRRAHAGQEVPERTLDQAGALAACKSWQKDAARARILYAEVRHIRSMRGAGTGTVRMDKILYSREVPVDASLETRLLPESPAGKTDGTGRD
ncbi:NFACT RNA binding domain-containing protein [Desulfovibrio piger]|uniref:NFACT RNA binding domain-containing protein n=1 Tax=Desulfovibrio piger TaxID=901 RepID=UPI001DC72C20|nr:NFACT RNA binding domain-containing protein [Desulfovibrio piger]HJG35210.1 NFACT RNA binding domain-containing protein [Desulfovibrio piger]